jgi:hypothetical protein
VVFEHALKLRAQRSHESKIEYTHEIVTDLSRSKVLFVLFPTSTDTITGLATVSGLLLG